MNSSKARSIARPRARGRTACWNFSINLTQRRLLVAGLLRREQWLHFDSESPCAHGGRGLSIAGVHDQQGQMVATVTQECLMAYAEAGAA